MERPIGKRVRKPQVVRLRADLKQGGAKVGATEIAGGAVDGTQAFVRGERRTSEVVTKADVEGRALGVGFEVIEHPGDELVRLFVHELMLRSDELAG